MPNYMFNCASCPSLRIGGMVNAPSAYCSISNAVVPHTFDGDDSMEFWRVPDFCKRDDVVKPGCVPVPKEQWISVSVKSIDKG